MTERSSGSNVNGNFAGLLTVLFIGLKLCHVIDWPWIWVLSPIWISLLLAIVLTVIAFILIVLYKKID